MCKLNFTNLGGGVEAKYRLCQEVRFLPNLAERVEKGPFGVWVLAGFSHTNY
jgi:hypothetical protein